MSVLELEEGVQVCVRSGLGGLKPDCVPLELVEGVQVCVSSGLGDLKLVSGTGRRSADLCQFWTRRSEACLWSW